MSLQENTARWRKTKRGVVTNLFNKMKTRHQVLFDLEYLHKFSECKKFNRLFSEWKKSNYNKQFKPSIDRISSRGVYSKRNIQWLTWAENRFKQTMERRSRKGTVAQMIGNKTVKIFSSQREAAAKTGLSQGNLSMAMTGKRELCGGYKWKFTKPQTS
jgi:hypothetical protein